MSEEEARALVALLTHEEKVLLNEMLESLEQTHQPAFVPPVSTATGA